jgi:hypothetical protein
VPSLRTNCCSTCTAGRFAAGQQEFAEAAARELFSFVAEDREEALVDREQLPRRRADADPDRRTFEDAAIAILRAAIGLEDGTVLFAQVYVAKLALERRSETRETVLGDEVVRAAADRVDGPFFAPVAGNEKERQLAAVRAHDAERLQAVEARHVVVGDDGRPRLGLQRVNEAVERVDVALLEFEPMAMQIRGDQLDVVEAVFNEQESHAHPRRA